MTVVLWCAIPLSPQSVDSDFWGHARYGWDTWHRGLAHESTYTYTAIGHRWINHENLSELFMAWGAFAVGPTSLLAIKCVLGCLILALGIIQATRPRSLVHPATMAVVCVVAALNLSFYWGLRPHVFTFVFFALMISLTDWCFQGWAGHWHLPWPQRRSQPFPEQNAASLSSQRLHALWLAPILLAVWANTHGGFLAGLAVYVALLLGRAAELLVARGVASWKTAAYLVVLAGAGALATLLTPYGLELHGWLIDSLTVPRPEIQEWHPPTWLGASAIKLWVMFALIAWGLLASRRPRDLTRLVILGLVLTEALKHQRHLPFVAILFLFWLPEHVQSAIDRLLVKSRTIAWPHSAWPNTRRIRHYITVGLMLLSGLLAYRVGTRLSGVPVSNQEYPVDALQFMSDQGLTGRLVVDGHWAQYSLGVMGAYAPGDPGVSVAFDGRFRTCYPQQVVDMYFDFFVGDGGPKKRYRSPASPPADPKRVLALHDPQLVLINRHEPHPVAVMQGEQDRWVLLYQDQLAQLWGRRSVYDQKGQASFFPPDRRQLDVANPQSVVPWPAAPRRHDSDVLAQTSLSATARSQTRHLP